MKLCLPPKRLSASLVAFALLVACSGCTTAANSQRNAAANPNNLPTYALAVAVRGGVEPTAAQWNAMYQKFSRSLAARGMLLINDHAKADNIIYVEFLPDPINPTIGTALISGISPNTGIYGRTAPVSNATYASSYSSSLGYANSSLGRSNYDYDDYNRYNGHDTSGSSSTPPPSSGSGAKPPAPPAVPPPHHRPLNPADCPPGTSPYQPPPSYVGNYPRHQGPREGGYTPPSYSSPRPAPRSDGSLSYSSANSSGQSAYSSSSNSSSSYSSSSPSSHSPAPSPTYSAPSYSAPVSSSLSYSSSADPASSSSSSSSAGSSSSSSHSSDNSSSSANQEPR